MSDIELIDEIQKISRYIQKEKNDVEINKMKDQLLETWRKLDKLRIDKLYKDKNEKDFR